MKKILKMFFNPWTMTILGLTAISALIWFAGPLIAFAEYYPLASDRHRTILIGLIFIFYISKLTWKFIKSRKQNVRFMEGLLQQVSVSQNSGSPAGSEEVAVLQKRFEEAVAVLKNANLGKKHGFFSRFNRQYIYELPWYIFIGAPGSGKTTALVNSGLQFPLAEHFGQEVIRGIGGTRNCDWWFTNEAILLDTAGRYTTQESDQEKDSAAWNGFLKLLRKYRPRRPINGIIVTVSITDLLQQSSTQREVQANAIRKRIQELHSELNIRFPIYVLVTKTDLLGGFMEFFGKYGKEDRTQVWGITFPLSEKEDVMPLANFDPEFTLLEQRLNSRLIDYLQDERDIQKRALLYTFPQQFSAMKETLRDFLNQIFSLSRFNQPPLLRGIYFTSGIQEGNPIDRIISSYAQALQLDSRQLIPNKPSGKSFFLSRLISDVILDEAEIAGTNLRWERQRALLQWSVSITALFLTFSLIAVWYISFSQNQAYVAEVAAKVPVVSKQVEQLPVVQNISMPDLISAFESVKGLAIVPGTNTESSPLSMSMGLYQGEKLASAANNAFQRLLQDTFLPQLILRLEYLLSNANSSNTELLYEGLKAYLMLHQADHFDPVALKAFIMLDWENNLPREISFDQRKILESHLDTLLNRDYLSSPISINSQLVNRVRALIAKTSLAQRIYNRLKLQGMNIDIPEFTIARNVGSSAALVFERKSGTPLTKGISGLYTYDGYYNFFPRAAKETTQQLAEEEPWVLDLPEKQRNSILDTHAESSVLEEVRRLYLQDYAKNWENFINDIQLVKASSLSKSIELTRLLSAADSPLLSLLQAVTKEITLVNTDTAEKNIVDKATDQVKTAKKKLEQYLGQPKEKVSTAILVSRPEQIVDEKFKDLRRLVQSSSPGQPAPIERLISKINELYYFLTTTEEALNTNTTLPVSKVQTEMRAEARQLSEPLRSMFASLSSSSQNQTEGMTRGNLNQSLKIAVTDFCQQATAGRYPFVKRSTQDVTQDDFAQLFSFGGRFDEYFQKELAQFVDNTKQAWHFRQTRDTPKDLQEFKRAQTIRDIFFRGGARVININFTFKPIDMDPSITQFILDVDGQLVKYSHGPQVPVSIQWPGPRGSTQVRLQITPAQQEGISGQVFEGPWALFRMFDNVQINPSPQPEKFNAIFNINGKKAQFEVTTSSVQNPFRLQELKEFRCPSTL
ncbi:MAG: type VI secretion system membrane subunit TssM [Nitrosomonas sp.]